MSERARAPRGNSADIVLLLRREVLRLRNECRWAYSFKNYMQKYSLSFV